MIQKIPPTIIAVIVLVIIAAGIIVLTLMDSHTLYKPVASDTGVKTNLPDPVTARVITPGTMTVTERPAAGQTAPATGSSDGVIELDPLGDNYGEYVITGTTSLPVGTGLVLQLRPDTGIPPTGYDEKAVGGGSAGNASITKGDGTLNRIVMRGSMSGQRPGKWVAVVGDGIYDNGYTMGRHIGYAYFNLEGDQASRSSVDSAGSTPIKGVNECSMTPVKEVNHPEIDGFRYYNLTVFTALSVENYSVPLTNKDPGIPIGQAKDIAKKAFPHYSPDRVDMEFSDGSQSMRGWGFSLYNDDQKIVTGRLDADTGNLMEYSVPFYSSEKPQGKPGSATTIDSARLAAESEIRARDGELPLKQVDSKVSPFGGWFFNYKRIIQGVPCTSDGITLDIDQGTGKVSRYFKSLHTPENAVAAQPVPAISRDKAIAVVEREAKACYPDSADSFTIVSADLRWMDLYNPDEFTPRPGVIPLAWYVRFDDKTIRGNEFPNPEEGWVDAQNGTLLSMEYFHYR